MRLLCCFILFILLSNARVFSQDRSANALHIDRLPKEGLLLDSNWKFFVGDNPAYASSDYDDRAWGDINPSLDIYDLPQIPRSGIVWFRLRLLVSDSFDKQLALTIQQSGASEIYLDGKLIQKFGVLSPKVKAYDPMWRPVAFPLKKNIIQVLAVRYALEPEVRYTTMYASANYALWMQINEVGSAVSFYHRQTSRISWFHILIIGACFLFCVLHFAFYHFYPTQKANFYLAMFALFNFTAILIQHIFYTRLHEIRYKFFLANISFVLFMVGNLFLLTAIHFLLNRKKDLVYWSLVLYVVISVFLNAGPYKWGWLAGGVLTMNLIQFNIARISLLALKSRKRGTLILVAGSIFFLLSFVIFLSEGKLVNNHFFLSISILSIVLFNMTHLSIPMAASVYLGLEFAFVNDSLQQKLKEVNELSQKNLAQEREKQQFLALQNETLERQVGERTFELSRSLKELKETQSQLIQQEKMASLGELTAGIAHEIQNPLNFVNNFSEVNKEMLEELKAERLKPQAERDDNLQDELINDVTDNSVKINLHGKRADTIVKGMLQHSQKSSGLKEPTDINALCEEYLRLSYHGLRAKDKSFNADFKTDFDEAIGKINIVSRDIGRVLLNLYNNAFYAVGARALAKATAVDDKKVTANANYKPLLSIQTRKKNNNVEITVTDNGNGIPSSIREKIFQPFFTTKPTGQGTGLGLSLSYDIIKAHGGEITVDTKEGEGSAFVIKLPIA